VGCGQVAVGNQPASAMFSAVRAQDGRVYRLVYGRTGRLTRADVDAFEESLRSFEPLSAAEAATLRPLRIDVVTVQPGQTVDDFVRQMAVERDPAGYFALLNGLDRGRTLRPGDQVKVVRQG
jgi:predicted Zn-dependent protease